MDEIYLSTYSYFDKYLLKYTAWSKVQSIKPSLGYCKSWHTAAQVKVE